MPCSALGPTPPKAGRWPVGTRRAIACSAPECSSNTRTRQRFTLCGRRLPFAQSVGAIEAALVERIAVTLWRQRRFVQAETASLYAGPSVQKDRVRRIVQPAGFGRRCQAERFGTIVRCRREQWSRKVLAEIEALGRSTSRQSGDVRRWSGSSSAAMPRRTTRRQPSSSPTTRADSKAS